jgi:hypothetical protein
MPTSGAIGNDDYTKLLLHCSGVDAATDLVDSSIGGLGQHPITAVGTAQLDTAQSKFLGSSLLLDGNSDYITVPDSNDWVFGTDPFTIDFWIRYNSYEDQNNCWLTYYYDVNNYWMLYHADFTPDPVGDYTIYFLHRTGGSTNISFQAEWTQSVSTGTWMHVAFIRGWGGNSNSFAVCVNGVLIDEALTDTDSIVANGGTLQIGRGWGGAAWEYIDGWMDEIRITKGVARWTEAFTPPTSPYRQYHSDYLNMLLIDCDGLDAHTSFLDSSNAGDGKVVTAEGGASITTDQYKFGSSCIELDDTTTDFLSLLDSDDWDFGTGLFTMDLWVRFATLPAESEWWAMLGRLTSTPSETVHFGMTNSSGTRKMFIHATGDSDTIGPFYWNWTPSTSTWYHVALIRGWGGNANDFMITVNGTALGSAETDTGTMPAMIGGFYVGSRTDSPSTTFDGWFDEVRVSKGVARWTANFTPPTSPYLNDEYTVLLLHGAGADESTDFIDSSGRIITAVGNAQGDTAQKQFGTAALLCDGTGDYLSMPASQDFNFGGLNLTMDCWVRFADLSAPGGYYNHGIMGQYTATNNRWELNTYVHDSGASVDLNFTAYDGGTIVANLSYADWDNNGLVVDQWYHIAVIRGWGGDPTVWALCVDGVAVDTDTRTTECIFYNAPLTIGSVLYSGQERELDGWVDEVRIVKGDARWTANFTPPQQPYPEDPYTTYFDINSVNGPSYIMGMDPALIVSVSTVEPS